MKKFKAKFTEDGLQFFDPEFDKYREKHVGQRFTVIFEEEELISAQQMKSIHVYFRLVADALNDSGQDMRVFIRQGITIPWTDKSVKEYLWRPVQKAMFTKKSSTRLSKEEVIKVYEVVDRELSQRAGIHIEFPAHETEHSL